LIYQKIVAESLTEHFECHCYHCSKTIHLDSWLTTSGSRL